MKKVLLLPVLLLLSSSPKFVASGIYERIIPVRIVLGASESSAKRALKSDGVEIQSSSEDNSTKIVKYGKKWTGSVKISQRNAVHNGVERLAGREGVET
jgi:hypothetical protein